MTQAFTLKEEPQSETQILSSTVLALSQCELIKAVKSVLMRALSVGISILDLDRVALVDEYGSNSRKQLCVTITDAS